MKEYKFKKGFQVKISAQEAGERLNYLYEKHKYITPEIVLTDARNKDSQLHEAFEWNDKIAAERFRIERATRLIGNLEITIEKEKDGNKIIAEVRVFHNIQGEKNIFEDRSSGYLTLEDAMENPAAKNYLLGKAYADLIAFKKKYETLMELKPFMEQIDQMILALEDK